MNELTNAWSRADWALATTDELEFEREQAELGHCWTLVGISHDLRNDGDWVRSSLGGRSIFVQRFGDVIRGFENRCAHRFFPLRTSDKGNGPMVCGFHHWRYDRDGRAVGIPNCPEVFGKTPRELDAKLNPLELATCGSLIFGRFPGDDTAQSLEDFLGEGFPILELLCAISAPPHAFGDDIKANWRLLIQITLDDYHLVAVHHRKNYSMNAEIGYFRFGAHSAHFVGHADTLASMAAECRENRYRPTNYRIFNIFPNLAVSLFKAAPYWYCNIQQFIPISAGHTKQRGWFFPAQFPIEESAFHRSLRRFSEPIRARIVRHYVEKTGDEDHRACEQLQTVARQIDRWPLLSWQEQRIAWFEEAYAQATAGCRSRVATNE